MSMAIVTIHGNLSKDAEMRYTPSGTAVVNFTVPVDEYKGQGEKVTCWYKMSYFGERAEKVMEYLKKGKNVCVVGRLTHSTWNGQDGTVNYSNDVTVLELSLGPDSQPRENGGQKSAARPAAKPAQAAQFEEEIDIPVA